VKLVGPVEGLTVTTMLSGVPEQELATGVAIYVTVPGASPGLNRVCDIVEPFDDVAPPTRPVIAPLVQLNVVPGTLLVNAIFVVAELHKVVGLTVETSGVGLTVTTIFTGFPGHPFAVGVTI
jgi:hypothetical protein